MPELKKGWPTGMLGLRADKDGNIWLGMMYQGAMAKFDPKAEKVQIFNLPPEMNKDMAQVNMVRAESAAVDGKVWSQNNGFAAIHRLDLATGSDRDHRAVQELGRRREPQHLRHHPGLAEQRLLHRLRPASYRPGRRQDRQGHALSEMPTKKSAGPRRGMMDAQDRLWFGEYRGNKIGMFDTKTEKFQEWPMPTPWSAPYDVAVDKNGEAWTGSMINDRVARLDPKTGAVRRVSAAARDQYPPRLRRQLDQPGDVLGRQQPRRLDRQARAAGLEGRTDL